MENRGRRCYCSRDPTARIYTPAQGGARFTPIDTPNILGQISSSSSSAAAASFSPAPFSGEAPNCEALASGGTASPGFAAKPDIRLYIFPQRLLSRFNSCLSFEFSLLSLSFSSIISGADAQARGVVAVAPVAAGDELEERTCSSPESAGEIWITATGATACNGCAVGTAVGGAAGTVETPVEIFRRWMSLSIAFSPRRKQ
ncbi:E3 ubiquitin-protein ligase HECTD3, partial [Striga asiatica]